MTSLASLVSQLKHPINALKQALPLMTGPLRRANLFFERDHSARTHLVIDDADRVVAIYYCLLQDRVHACMPTYARYAFESPL